MWGKTVQTIPAEQMQFVLNGAVDTLLYNANLQLWRKESDTCPQCGESKLSFNIHVLNCCRVAQDLRRYNHRHDLVLGVIADAVRQKLPPLAGLSADLSNSYSFPLYIASINKQLKACVYRNSELNEIPRMLAI